MNNDFNHLSEIDRAACQWVSIINSDGASDEELRQFGDWVGADPAHAAAFAHYEGLFVDVAELKDLEYLLEAAAGRKHAGVIDKLVTAMRGAFAHPLIPVMGIAAIIALMVVSQVLLNPSINPHSYATHIAETRDIALPDGSVLTLGARSVAEVDYKENVRSVILLNGQAFFDVTPDPARPFVIQAGRASVQVVGTRFDVKLISQETHVAVAEGIVSVRGSTDRAVGVQLFAGEAVSVAGGDLSEVHSIDVDAIEAWRKGRLIYDNAPLREVVADLNRYASRRLALEASVDETLTITGAFKVSDVDGVIRAVAATHDLEVIPANDGVRTLQPKKR